MHNLNDINIFFDKNLRKILKILSVGVFFLFSVSYIASENPLKTNPAEAQFCTPIIETVEPNGVNDVLPSDGSISLSFNITPCEENSLFLFYLSDPDNNAGDILENHQYFNYTIMSPVYWANEQKVVTWNWRHEHSDEQKAGRYVVKGVFSDDNFDTVTEVTNLNPIWVAPPYSEETPNIELQDYDTVYLNWNPVESAEEYEIKRYKYQNPDYIEDRTWTVNANIFTDSLYGGSGGLEYENNYKYIISAINPGGKTPLPGATINTPLARPAIPGNFTVSGNQTDITLNWNQATGASHYQIVRYINSSGIWIIDNGNIDIPNPTTTIYTDNGLSSNTEYKYTIRSINSNGIESYIISSTPAVIATVPNTPINFNVENSLNGGLYISWDEVATADSFKITKEKYNEGTTNWDSEPLIETINPSHYQDDNVLGDTLYRYKIKSSNESGDSADTAPIQIQTKPEGPQNVTASLLANDSIKIEWDAGPPDTVYKIERYVYKENGCTYTWNFFNFLFPSAYAGSEYCFDITISNNYRSSLYLDINAEYGKKYKYLITIRGENTDSVSVFSNEVKTRPEPVDPISLITKPYGIEISWGISEGANNYQVIRERYYPDLYECPSPQAYIYNLLPKTYAATDSDGVYCQDSILTQNTTLNRVTDYYNQDFLHGIQYRWLVLAQNESGSSPKMYSDTIITSPEDVYNISLNLVENGIFISWDESDGAASYKIARYKYISGSNCENEYCYEKTYQDITVNQFTDTYDNGVLTDNSYYYLITAVSGTSNSNSSQSEIISTLATQSTPPTLQITSTYTNPDKTFDIKWTDIDDDSSAYVSIYSDPSYSNTALLEDPDGNRALNIPEDPDGSIGDVFTWDTSNLEEGDYNFYIRICDEHNCNQYDSETVTVVHPPTISLFQPRLDPDNSIYDAYTEMEIFWEDNDTDENAFITLYYYDDGYNVGASYILEDSNGYKAQSIEEDPDGDGDIFKWDVSDMDNTPDPVIWADICDTKGFCTTVQSPSNVDIHKWDGNEPSVFTFVSPVGGESINGSFDIEWTNYDDDDDRMDITLWYSQDYDYKLDNLHLVKDSGGLPVSPPNVNNNDNYDDGIFTWDTTNIPQGDYFIIAEICDQTCSYEFSEMVTVTNTNTPPSIDITKPDGTDDDAITNFYITWTDDDPDNDAKITLWYDYDMEPGHIIKNNRGQSALDLSEDDGTDAFTWYTENIPVGEYSIVAKICDDMECTYDYSDPFKARIVPDYIPPEIEMIAPGISLIQPDAQNNITISWLDIHDESSSPPPSTTINLYYDTDTEGFDGTLINPTPINAVSDGSDDTFIWNLDDLSGLEYFVYGIITDGYNENKAYAPGSVKAPYCNSTTKECFIPQGSDSYYINAAINEASILGNISNFYTIILDDTIFELNTSIELKDFVNIKGLTPNSTLSGSNSRTVIKASSITYPGTLENFTVTNGHGLTIFDGGGIQIDNTNLTIKNLNITNNYTLGRGAGITINNTTLVTIENTSISNNESDISGGGIYSFDSSLELVNTTISNNIANTGPAGGIYMNGGELTMVDTNILNNEALSDGGGMMFARDVIVSIAGGEISRNTSSGNGGGIAIRLAHNFSIEHTDLNENTATNDGGAIFLEQPQDIRVSYAKILSNSANLGAGFFVSEPIEADRVHDISLDHTLIAENTTVENCAAIYEYSYGSKYDKVTIANNTTPGAVGGACFHTGTNERFIKNSVVAFNSGVQVIGTGAAIPISYSLLTEGAIGTGNINYSGLESDLFDADYRPPSNSNLIGVDMGDPTSPLDPDGTRTDMGYSYFDAETDQNAFFQFTKPASDIFILTGTYTIEWEDYDDYYSGVVDIYYDIDNTDTSDAILIEAGIPIAPDGDSDTLVWDISEIQPNTPYYLAAIVDDGVNPPFTVYSTGTVQSGASIIIINPDGIDDVVYTGHADPYPIRWEDSAPGNGQISLYYDTDDEGFDGVLINQTPISEDPDGPTLDMYGWDISGMPSGTYYIYAEMLHYNILDGVYTRDYSNYPLVITDEQDNYLPTIRITKPTGHEYITEMQYTIEWIDEDPDDNASIDLFYVDEINATFPIVTGIEEDDPNNEYDWDISNVPEGTYHIGAKISSNGYSYSTVSEGIVTIKQYCDTSTKICPIPIDSTAQDINKIALSAHKKGYYENTHYTLLFESGIYTIDEPINISKYVNLKGRGRDQTIIKGSSTNLIEFKDTDETPGAMSYMTLQDGYALKSPILEAIDSSIIFRNVTVKNNNLELYNGNNKYSGYMDGLIALESSNFQTYNTIIYGNSTVGPIISNDNASGDEDYGNIHLENTVVYGNSGANTSLYRTGIFEEHIEASEFTMLNSIIFNNNFLNDFDLMNDPEIYSIKNNITDFSLDEYFDDGADNITFLGSKDQLFEDADSGNFILNNASIAIDFGFNSAQFNDPEDTSYTGSSLPYSKGTTRNDIGAFGGPKADKKFGASNLGPKRMVDGSRTNNINPSINVVATDFDSNDSVIVTVELSKNSDYSNPQTYITEAGPQGTRLIQLVNLDQMGSGNFYWRAHVEDNEGNISSWTEANDNGPAFILDLNPPNVFLDYHVDEYMSIRGNKTNSFNFRLNEEGSYSAYIKNTFSDRIIRTFTGSSGVAGTTLVWDGIRNDFKQPFSSFKNLSSPSYGDMTTYGNIGWSELPNYKKEFINFFNMDEPEENVLSFDGSTSYMSATPTSELSFYDQGITIEAWIYPENSNEVMPIISREDDNGLGNYKLEVNDGNIQFKFRGDEMADGSYPEAYCLSSIVLPKDRWSFVALSHRFSDDPAIPNDTFIYVNGEKGTCVSEGSLNKMPQLGNNLYIGYSTEDKEGDGDDYFRGNIANIAIYDTNLDENRIGENMNKIPSGSEPNMLGYWRFYNSAIADDGPYKWYLDTTDAAGNENQLTVQSNEFKVDNSPPLITNVKLSYDVEEHIRRDENGYIICNVEYNPLSEPCPDPTMFTEKIVEERVPGSYSYEISRDVKNSPKINLSFNADGMVDYKSIQVIPYTGALGPGYPSTNDLIYHRENPTKNMLDIPLLSNTDSEQLQMTNMTLVITDMANNVARRSLEIINHLPKIHVSKISDISGAEPPVPTKDPMDYSKVECDKDNPGVGPYCDLISNTLTISNLATPTTTLINSEEEFPDTYMEAGDIDIIGPNLYVNDVSKNNIETLNIVAKVNIPYYFSADGTNDKNDIFSYFWEIKKDGNQVFTSLDKNISYPFDSVSAGYTINFQATDNKGNTDSLQITSDQITVLTEDNDNPVARIGNDEKWPVNVPYFFDAGKSTDNIQVDPQSFKWDFNANDGVDFNNPDFIGKRAVTTFTSLGDHIITLQVADTSGRTDTDSITVTTLNEEKINDSTFNPVSGFTDLDSSYHLEGIDFSDDEKGYAVFDAIDLYDKNEGTIEFWMSANPVETTDNQTMISLGSGLATQVDKNISISIDPYNYLILKVVDGNDEEITINAKSKNPLSFIEWHKISFAFGEIDGTYKNNIYVDGEEIEMNYSIGNNEWNIHYYDFEIEQLTIGAYVESLGLTDNYHGKIDDIEIWDKKLTQSEIAGKLYTHPKGNEAHMIYFVDMDNIEEYDTTKSISFNGISTKATTTAETILRTSFRGQYFSAGLWEKLDNISNEMQPLISLEGHGSDGVDHFYDPGNFSLFIDPSRNRVGFSYNQSADTAVSPICYSPDDVIKKNIWQYIAFNIDWTNIVNSGSFNIDNQIYNCNFSPAPNDSAPALGEYIRIGYYTESGEEIDGELVENNKHFSGNIDNISLWDTLRTPTEIAEDRKGHIQGNEDGLITYWRFEEGRGNKSSNEVTTDYGEVTFSNPIWSDNIISGETNSKKNTLSESHISAVFDGTSYINVDGTNTGAGNNDMTAELWFKSETMTNRETLIHKKENIDTGAGFYIYADPEKNYLMANITDQSGNSTSFHSIKKLSELTDNNWHHIAFVVDKTEKTSILIIDDKIDSSKDISDITDDTSNIEFLKIGQELTYSLGSPHTSNFIGEMSDVRLWDIARPLSEIRQDKNIRITPDYPYYDRLKTYLKLNELNSENPVNHSGYDNVVASFNISSTDPNLEKSSPAFPDTYNSWWSYQENNKDYSVLFHNQSSINITSGYSNLLSDKENYSIEMWIEPTASYQSMTSDQYLISRDTDNNFNMRLTEDGKIIVQTSNADSLETPANIIKKDKWTHIAFVYNQGAGDIYIDGQPIAHSASLDRLEILSNEDLNIGKAYDNSGYYHGYMSDLKFWDKSLSISNILEYISKRIERSSKNYQFMSAYYPLNDINTTGNLLYDFSLAETPSIGSSQNLLFSNNTIDFINNDDDIHTEKGHETTFILSGHEYAKFDFNSDTGIYHHGNNKTVEAWVKPSKTEGDQIIIDRMVDVDGYYNGFRLFLHHGYVHYENRVDETYISATGNKPIDDDKWHHIAFTEDVDHLVSYLFVDGIIQNPENKIISDFINLQAPYQARFIIGNQNPYSDEVGFVGEIDSVRVSNTVRYSQNFIPQKEFLNDSYTMKLYTFNEGSGSKIYDMSSYTNNLTVYGDSPAFSDRVSPDYAIDLKESNGIYIEPRFFEPSNSNFTIDFYLKTESIAGYIFGWGQYSSGTGIYLNFDATGLHFSMAGSQGSFLNNNIEDIDYHINDGNWHHIAISVDRSGFLNLFINGSKYYSKDISGNPGNSIPLGVDMYFGSKDGTSPYLDALIDEIVISQNVRYSENFVPPTKNSIEPYIVSLFHINPNPDNPGTIQNNGGELPLEITSSTGTMILQSLNTPTYIGSASHIYEPSGHFLNIKEDNYGKYRVRGKAFSPSMGYMYFDRLPDPTGQNHLIHNLNTPYLKNYDPQIEKNQYEMIGAYYSPNTGWFTFEENPMLDTKTGTITSGNAFNPTLGFNDWSGKRVRNFDLKAPLIQLDPIQHTFISAKISSIELTGSTTDRFGVGTAKVEYKLNDGGFRMAIDDSVDKTFSRFRAVVKGLKLGENIITFKTEDFNGNVNENAKSITIYRGYDITYTFFAPHPVTKVVIKGDESQGISRIPSDYEVYISNNKDFIDNPLEDKYTWKIIDINTNRSDEEQVYMVDDFLGGYDANASNDMNSPQEKIQYARLLINDTVGHEAPYVEEFKVYTEVDNALREPWSVEDNYDNHMDGVEFYWDGDYGNKPQFKPAGGIDVWLKDETDIENIITNNNGKDVKFRFSGSENQDIELLYGDLINTTIPPQDSVEIKYKSLVTKDIND